MVSDADKRQFSDATREGLRTGKGNDAAYFSVQSIVSRMQPSSACSLKYSVHDAVCREECMVCSINPIVLSRQCKVYSAQITVGNVVLQ